MFLPRVGAAWCSFGGGDGNASIAFRRIATHPARLDDEV
jgi:dolichol kinase